MNQNKYAIVFPGQSAQYIGMGTTIYNQYKFVREMFEEAEDVLKLPIRDICFKKGKVKTQMIEQGNTLEKKEKQHVIVNRSEKYIGTNLDQIIADFILFFHVPKMFIERANEYTNLILRKLGFKWHNMKNKYLN